MSHSCEPSVGDDCTRKPRDIVLELVQTACSEPNNRFGPEFLEEHLLLVERFALDLAERLGADRRIVQVAALAHDLSAIRDFASVAQHAELGAELVQAALSPGGPLSELAFDGRSIELVALCVREHSMPRQPQATCLESVAVSNADAMAQIARPLYWYHYARTARGLGHSAAMEWYGALVKRNLAALIDIAQPLIELRAQATRVVLEPV